MELIVGVIKAPILILVLSVWTVVGFLFWIPLLARSVATFTFLILHSALTREPPTGLQEQLYHSVAFYIHGFRLIFLCIYSTPESHSETPVPRFHFAHFVLELFWAILFWAAIWGLLASTNMVTAPSWLTWTRDNLRELMHRLNK